MELGRPFCSDGQSHWPSRASRATAAWTLTATPGAVPGRPCRTLAPLFLVRGAVAVAALRQPGDVRPRQAAAALSNRASASERPGSIPLFISAASASGVGNLCWPLRACRACGLPWHPRAAMSWPRGRAEAELRPSRGRTDVLYGRRGVGELREAGLLRATRSDPRKGSSSGRLSDMSYVGLRRDGALLHGGVALPRRGGWAARAPLPLHAWRVARSAATSQPRGPARWAHNAPCRRGVATARHRDAAGSSRSARSRSALRARSAC